MKKVYEAIPSTITTTNIIPGADLMVYNNAEAALLIGESLVEFKWTKDAQSIFADLENADVIELLAVMAQCEKYVDQEAIAL